MDTRHLKIFITVCDCRNMTHAAGLLFMTQPSVSQAIAELEKDYGVRLFERLNHKLFLTAAGERLKLYASHILNLSDQVKKELSDLTLGGSIRIGASLTTGVHLLPGIVTAFREQMPNVDIFTQVDNTSLIEKLILEDQLDIGMVEGLIYSPHIIEETLCNDDLVIICGPGHPFWDKGSISITELAGSAFIIREPGSGTRDEFEKDMNDAGANWKIAGVYNNTEAIKHAVRGNLGLAVVPKISIEEEVTRGMVRQIEVKGLRLKRKFNLVYHRQKYFSHAIQAFVNCCKKYPLPS